MFSLQQRYPGFRKAVIVLFSIPLMFTGGSFLGGFIQNQSVGEVGSISIPRSEFSSRDHSAIEDYRRRAGSEEVPNEVSNRIVQEVQQELLASYLLRASLDQKGIYAPDEAVADAIRENTEFHDDDGNFSTENYNEMVSDQRYYQDQIRFSVGRGVLLRAMSPLPLSVIRNDLASFRRQERIVDEAIVPWSSLATVSINISQEDINLYYQRNRGEYAIDEEGVFEYFLFNLDDFSASLTVSNSDIEEAYEEYLIIQEEFNRREVSHILVDDNAQAEELYERLVNNVGEENFVDIAKSHSTDAGSAYAGGKLGIFATGDLPETLDAVVSTMTVGQISLPIEVDEGYSILRLDNIIVNSSLALPDVRDEMERLAKRKLAIEDYDEKVTELRDMAPLEIGSLVSMAAEINVSTIITATLSRFPTENSYPFDREEILLDVFDPIVISERENSQPIPVGEDSYLFVRALNYQPSGFKPLAEVALDIDNLLRANYTATDLYQQIESSHQALTVAQSLPLSEDDVVQNSNLVTTAVTSTLSAPDDSSSKISLALDSPQQTLSSNVSIDELLEGIDWKNSYTVVLAGDEDDVVLDNAEENSTTENSPSNEAKKEDQLEDVAVDRIFLADLSFGLPAYVFLPEDDGNLRIFRIKKMIENEPLAEDFSFVDEFLENITSQLSGNGYLDSLIGQNEYEFYNLPDNFNSPAQ